MKDIESRDDIILLVDKFYKQVLADELIGVFFNEVVKLNVDTHIPILYDFWATILIGEKSYKANAMLKHIQLNQKKAIKPKHFERWIGLWEKTVSENFVGEKAQLALQRAKQIGELMLYKVGGMDPRNGERFGL